MKATEFVKLASVRASMKNANTPSAKVKFLYVLAQENGGEATFTTHLYPTEGEFHYTHSDGVKLRIWPMDRSVADAFVV